jgi:hypothetical protein
LKKYLELLGNQKKIGLIQYPPYLTPKIKNC